jgi:uncharacterized RDD family membrane protein YckC
MDKEYNFAGFLIRFAAFFIDALILTVPIIYVKKNFAENAVYINMAISAIYNTAFVGFYGKTPGKMLFRLKIIKTSGDNVNFIDAFIRYLATILSQIILFAGYLMVIWDKRKQALHDKIAKTYVVIEETIG